MKGMGRIWQGAGTVNSLLGSFSTEPRLLENTLDLHTDAVDTAIGEAH